MQAIENTTPSYTITFDREAFDAFRAVLAALDQHACRVALDDGKEMDVKIYAPTPEEPTLACATLDMETLQEQTFMLFPENATEVFVY